MKKNFLKILIISIMLLTIFTLSGCFQTYKSFEYEEENGEITIKHYNDTSTQLEVIVPDEINGKPVVKISDFGIVDTKFLETLTIGKNIREIAPVALKNHENLKNIFVAEGNEHFKSIDGVLYTADGKEIVSYPTKNRAVQNSDKTWTIPPYRVLEGTEIIREYAFYHVNGITEISMPDTVKRINSYSFMINGDSLKNINLSKNLEYIGVDAFSLNKGLKSITIYDKITQIEKNAFYNCSNLLTVNICKSESEISFGDKWYPSNLGRKLKDLKINYNYQV